MACYSGIYTITSIVYRNSRYQFGLSCSDNITVVLLLIVLLVYRIDNIITTMVIGIKLVIIDSKY